MARVDAAAGVPAYWIINLVDRWVEVYTDPCPEGCRVRSIYWPGQSVPIVLDGAEVGRIAVDDMLPRE